MARPPQMTLPSQVFAFAVAVAPNYLAADPKAFNIGEALDLPLCENIKDTLSISNIEYKTHTIKFPRDKAIKPLTSWKNSYTNQY
jgi:hypothetical protein